MLYYNCKFSGVPALIRRLCVLFCLLSPALMAAPLNVVASIRPLQLIADSLVEGLGETTALIPAGSSPHHFALKPSQLKLIQNADLVLWVGPSLEPFLDRPLSSRKTLQLRWIEHEAGEHKDEAHSHAGHDHAGEDPHVWLDPDAAMGYAQRLKTMLLDLRPHDSVVIEANFQRFKEALAQADAENRDNLTPLLTVGFVVFHDAFNRLVSHYGLNQVAYLTLEPGLPPGARKTAEIRRLLSSGEARCIFIEPQFEAALINRLIADLPVASVTLDPLASDLDSALGYPGFLRHLGEAIRQCLGENNINPK